MKRLLLIFVATFILGMVLAVVVRTRHHHPYAPKADTNKPAAMTQVAP